MIDSPSQSSIHQIVKTQIVEIPITTITDPRGQFKFPTQNFLRNKYIISIEAFDATTIPRAPSGNVVVTPTNLQNSFLTLYEQNPEAIDAQGIKSSGEGEWNELIPLVTLQRVQNSTPTSFVRELSAFVPRVVIWEKSYVQLATGTVLDNGTPISFLFQVGYIGNFEDKK